jgi:hypothetical protein
LDDKSCHQISRSLFEEEEEEEEEVALSPLAPDDNPS